VGFRAVTPELQAVAELRQQLWSAGFRPVPVLTGDKIPSPRDGWPDRARLDPPECTRFDPVAHAANTGLLADELRLVDVDCDDPYLVEDIKALAFEIFGPDPPMRWRPDSSRVLLVYAAAEGAPPTITITGSKGKVQILGHGSHALSFGRHPSGADLRWVHPPGEVARGDLTAITEAQVHSFLVGAAEVIEAPPPGAPEDGAEHVPGEPQAGLERLQDALGRIPNDTGPPDWEAWNRLGMALWVACGGSDEGLELWLEFSARHPSYDEKETRDRWRHYHRSRPGLLGAGTIFHEADLADQARLGDFLDIGVSAGKPEPSAESEPVDSEPADSTSAEDQANGKDEDDPWKRAAEPEPDAGQPEPSLPELPAEPDWPEPIAREAYRGLLGEIIDATIPTTEADRNAVLLQHLVFFGNAIGISDTTPWCWGGKVVHRTNLSVLIAGKSAYARKGTSTAEVRFFYNRVDPFWCKDHIRSGLSSGEGLIWAVRDELSHLDDQGNVVIDHEASQTKNILVIESEFSRVLKMLQRQGNALDDVIKQAWDSDLLETMVKNKPVRATGHLVSLIAHDTFASLSANLPLVSTQDGFANRIAMACAQREKMLPVPLQIDANAVTDFVTRLRQAIEAARFVGEMTKTTDGQTVWGDLYHLLGEEKPGLYGAAVSRGDVQVLRMAMLYALLDQRREIGREHLLAAYAVWRYCAASVFFLFGERQTNPTAEKVLDELRQAGPRGATRTDLHTAFNRHITKGALVAALAQLARDGLVKRELRVTGGRPAEVWFYQERP
jgi:hypothetical protein